MTVEAWRVRTLSGALAAAGAGVLLLLVGLSAPNWLAGLHSRLTVRLLSRTYDPVSGLASDAE